MFLPSSSSLCSAQVPIPAVSRLAPILPEGSVILQAEPSRTITCQTFYEQYRLSTCEGWNTRRIKMTKHIYIHIYAYDMNYHELIYEHILTFQRVHACMYNYVHNWMILTVHPKSFFSPLSPSYLQGSGDGQQPFCRCTWSNWMAPLGARWPSLQALDQSPVQSGSTSSTSQASWGNFIQTLGHDLNSDFWCWPSFHILWPETFGLYLDYFGCIWLVESAISKSFFNSLSLSIGINCSNPFFATLW